MRRFYFLWYLFFISNTILAQTSKISGKVISASSGQVLSNATVFIIGKSKTAIADQNGSFTFSKLLAGTYSMRCSYIGYNEKIIDEIIIKNDEIVPVTISLDEKKTTNEGIIVTTTRIRAARESVASLLIAQKNSANVSDGVSAESIRKTPDRSTSDVIKRISGASIQDDRFAIIRGLNDRYNAAFINGAPLPSTESDRKAFAFDIFPSAILDNLIIYKTATPDKSGEFSGGIIDITTKSIPAKSFTSVSIGGGYNSLLTKEGRYSSKNKGKRDWLGVDDGTRGIPAGVPDTLSFLNPSQRAEIAKLYGNRKWGIKQKKTSPNFNFQLAKGFNIERKQKEFLGALFALTYNRNFTLNQGDRTGFNSDVSVQGSPIVSKNSYKDSLYDEEIVWAALGNISIKINNNNNIGFKNNFSINTDNKLLKRFGFSDISNDPDLKLKENVSLYTSNQIYSSQVIGEHQVGPVKTKITWLAAYSTVKREVPDISRLTYTGYDGLSANFSSGTISQNSGSGTMFSSNSDENIKSIKADIYQPYTFMKSLQNFIKIGGGFQKRERDFTSRLLGLSKYNAGNVSFDYNLLDLPEDQIFLPEHLGILKNGKGGFLLNDGTLPKSSYDAASQISYVYFMNDQRFFKTVRLIYGARIERFNQKLNSFSDVNPVNLNTAVTDFLPSVNFVYSVTSKMNVRLSYSVTVNRPEFRELAPFLFYDNVSQYTYEGYDSLRRAKIKNYDFRYEFFPGKEQLFSISVFYKDFTDPIEIVSNPIFDNIALYQNARSAKVYGLEAEFRTLISTLLGIAREGAFLSKFTLAGNGAYTKSNVKLRPFGALDPRLAVTDRSLQGQSPYIINGSAGFNDEKTGLSSTVSVNRVGDKISLAGTIYDADLYEKARTVVDFQLAKFFLKNKLELKFTARDILAQDIRFYYDFDKSKSFSGGDQNYSSYIAPKVFTLNATYKF
ncbi:MAG: TonB-dependent receptor [Ginsengibacter sp.]